MRTKEQKTPELDPQAALQAAQAELNEARTALESWDPASGTVAQAAEAKRRLEAGVEIAQQRFAIAKSRAEQQAFTESEVRLLQLEKELRDAESELERERQDCRERLAGLLDADWLEGRGRYALCPPAWGGLVGHGLDVQRAGEKVEAIRREISRLQNAVADRRSQQDRERRARIADALRTLASGGSAAVDLVAYRVEIPEGYASECAHVFRSRGLPASIEDGERAIYILLPLGASPKAYAGSYSELVTASPADEDELPENLAAILARATG